MSLPRNVRKQAKAAADHFENPAPEDDPSLGGAPEGDDKTPTDDAPVEDAAKTQEKPSETEPKTEPKDEDRDASYWRHRHNVLQGKYNGEVPKLHAEIRDLKAQIADKDRELAKAPQAGSAPGDLTEEQIAQFRETFGEDVVDMVTRLIEQKSGAAAQPDNSVEDLETRLARIEREKEEELEARFWDDLERAVPNYVQINQDPKFLNWLGQINPETRRAYQDDLIEAQQASNAHGVAKVFKLFLNQSPEPVREDRKIPEEDIEPKTSRTTTTPPGGNKRVWSGADIDKFYRDKMKGKLRKDEAERLEADIFAAQKEGRTSP